MFCILCVSCVLCISIFDIFCICYIFCIINIFFIFNKFVMYWQHSFFSVMPDLLCLPRPWTTIWWMTAHLFPQISAAGRMWMGWCWHKVGGPLWSITKSMPNTMKPTANPKMIENSLVDIWPQKQRVESFVFFLWRCNGPKYFKKVKVVLCIFNILRIFCIL